ncbi:TrmH family RNA methyltransferase [Candidatus Daviesbacteria bacterium]|nr:TrmH family RNA methyltransferase [Candidatus Daviesbacteria bacterium]
MRRLNATQLRKGLHQKIDKTSLKKQEIYIILDNVLDTYNIGSIFRLADAVAAKKIYLCGGTETPPNHRIKKASINTTEWVDWEYKDSAVLAVRDLKDKVKNIQIVAIEQVAEATLYNKFEYKLPIALIVGHESEGVSKEVLNLCDGVVEIPMFGVNVSLNVMVSLGIVLYQVIEKSS